MSHNQRLHWLSTIGFKPDPGSYEIPGLGTSLWMRGERLGIEESFWLSARDGTGLVHGETTLAKSWQELQAWLLEKPEQKKPLAAQRNLFGDED